MTRGKCIACAVALGGFFLLTFIAIAMARGLNVDEHQFIASGALLAREGSLPYRDYPYFHTPYLIFVYALLFHGCNYLLLSARVLSIVCAWIGLVLVTGSVWRGLSGHFEKSRAFIVACTALLMFLNPLVRYSCWRAWNHPLSILFATAAVLCLWRAVENRQAAAFSFGAGLLLSLAIGTRLSFAPLVPAFAGVCLLAPQRTAWRKRLQNALLLVLGGAIGALPMLWLFALAPRAFVFGNFTWNGPIYDLVLEASGQTITLASKVVYIFTTVLSNSANLVLLLLFLGLQFFALRQREFRTDPRNLLVLASLPCLLFGALAPRVSHDQYFYAFVPFLGLGLLPPLVALAKARVGSEHILRWAFAIAVAINLISSYRDFGYLARLPTPSRWGPMAVHHAGVRLARITGPGPVLTLAPTTALEGGLPIYTHLAASPFAWNTAVCLSEEQRREFGFIGPQNVDTALEPASPGAICTGWRGLSEQEIAHFKELGYRPFDLPDREIAWIRRAD